MAALPEVHVLGLLQHFVIENVQETGRKLGEGAYGTVIELEANGVTCAGKKLHASLVDPENDGMESLIINTFQRECQLMSNLRHPHLVQFLGVCFLPQVPHPVLVMERLHTNLDKLLESSPDIPLPIKCSILTDVARGLVYLHHQKPDPVVHRDLSARNVLLTSSLDAKIADLGNSRIVQLQPGQLALTLTRVPGTPLYMPPEALGDRAVYGCSLDVFSFGHLALYTLTQEFPGNLPAATYIDPHNPGKVCARTEIERRERFMQSLHNKLGSTHPLVTLVTLCLDNDPTCRPHAAEILDRLSEVERQFPNPVGRATKLEMMETLKVQGEQLQRVEREMAEVKEQVEHLEETVARRETLLTQRDEELRAISQELHQRNVQLHRNTTLDPQPRMANPTLELRWRECCVMKHATEHPSAVVLQGKVYMGGGWSGESDKKNTAVAVYDPKSDEWDHSLPLYKTEWFGMAAIHGKLVLAGGRDPRNGKESKDIGVWDPRRHKWTAPYSQLRSARYLPTVIGYRKWLIVAGGGNSAGSVVNAYDLVEVLDTATNEWFTASPLPLGCIQMSHALLNDTLYLLGGWKDNAPIKEVFAIPLHSLIVDALCSTSRSGSDPPPSSPWRTLATTPLGYSTALAFQGALLAIGGKRAREEGGQAESCIYRFERSMARWISVGELAFPRYWCASVALPSGFEFLILGGRNSRQGSRSRFGSVTLGTVANTN